MLILAVQFILASQSPTPSPVSALGLMDISWKKEKVSWMFFICLQIRFRYLEADDFLIQKKEEGRCQEINLYLQYKQCSYGLRVSIFILCS